MKCVQKLYLDGVLPYSAIPPTKGYATPQRWLLSYCVRAPCMHSIRIADVKFTQLFVLTAVVFA